MPISNAVRVWQIGRMEYHKALNLQRALVKRHKEADSQSENTLLILEHDPVYTIGIRSKGYTDEQERRLRSLGADFYRSDRGGLITFHGPGQLVAYPILNLAQFSDSKGPIGLRRYVEKLQSTVISTCLSLGLTDCKVLKEYPGVWVGLPEKERKLCAVGVRAGRYIVSHGLSLNCNVDLKWFEHVVPCGIEGKEITSISKELRTTVSVNDALSAFLPAFSSEFSCEICEFPVSLAQSLLYYAEKDC